MNRPGRVVVEVPAKVNLFLEIVGTAENGYHLLDTVMQAVSLCDLVVIGRRPEPGVRITCSRAGIPEDETNLAYRAAALFLAETGARLPGGLHLHIDKRIPARAGLGGGSADAAAVLAGLDRLLETGLSPERLGALALRLGADVPFLLRGGCALAEGVGEKLTPLPDGLRGCPLVIAKPETGMDTREAYERYDASPPADRRDSGRLRRAVAGGGLAAAGAAMYNAFERVLPESGAARIRDVMLAADALGAALSGSGSAVAGLFRDRTQAESCARSLAAAAGEVFLAEAVAHGPRIVYEN